jgi:phosphomevalonate kinase
VASLSAVLSEKDPRLDERALQASVFEPALEAHRRAQGGGSGIDVAASTYGGTQIVALNGDTLSIQHVMLPAELCLETWFSGRSASTSALIARVSAFRARDPRGYRELLRVQTDASARAVDAVVRGEATRFIRARTAQQRALFELGRAANAEIVTRDLETLHLLAERGGAVLLPSGAGGGDVALYAAPVPSGPEFRQTAENLGYRRIEPLTLSARGVHRLPSAL